MSNEHPNHILMKRTLLYSGLALALAGIARADFDPIPLTPNSFTADVVVENTAAHPLQAFITASMDGGTNGTGATWFERGINSGLPSVGLPPADSLVEAVDDANHQFRMPASYAVNNAVFLRTDQNPTGSLVLSTPTVLTNLSIMCSAGGGAVTVDYTIHYEGGGTEAGQFTCPDWYNNTPIAVYARGRLQVIGANFQNLYDVNPRLAYVDLPLYGSAAVSSIDFSAPYGGGRACIMGLSGEATTGAGYSPLAVTGFNADMVIEAAAEVFAGVYTATTATMDGGTNNTSNVWFEQGLNTGNLNSGLPPAGSTFAALSNANYSFTMPSSYVGNNAVLIASIVPDGTLTLDTPVALTGLSFLASFGGGGGSVNYTVHFQDGSADEVGSVNVPDWYNGESTTAWISDGRFNTDDGTFNAAGNPRLNFNDITLANTTSLVSSIDFNYGSGGRCSILALSAAVRRTSV